MKKILKVFLAVFILFNTFQVDIHAADDKTTQLEIAVNKVLEGVDSSMNDVEKLLYLHDYLLLNVEYDYDNYLNNNIPFDSFDEYGALVNGYAVCQGYSEAFQLLAVSLGFECEIVSSGEMNHAWNIVKLDGKWYHIDVTWDDPVRDNIGRAYHDNFLRSDTGIKETGHYGWYTKRTCSSTKYDDMDWINNHNAYYYDDGAWYTMIGNKVLKYDDVLKDGKVIKDFGDYSYCNIFIYDGKNFYYCTDQAIRKTDKKFENIKTLYYVEDNYIDGILYKDGKYYKEIDDKVTTFDPNKAIDVTFELLIDEINVVVGDVGYFHETNYFKLDPKYAYYNYYVKDESIAYLEDRYKVHGLKEGKTELIIESENGQKISVDINVRNTTISLEYTIPIVKAGKYQWISYQIESVSSDVRNTTPTFKSSNSNIAQIGNGSFVYGVAPGVATITATTKDGVSDSIDILVVDKTGWIEFNGDIYYMHENGNLADGKLEINGDTYYFDYYGKMLRGWVYDRDGAYYFDEEGKMVKGWQAVEDNICYFNEETGNLEKTLEDVEKKWYFNVVLEACQAGLMSGTTESTFEPNSPMTRGMVATVLYRIAGKPDTEYVPIFPDVQEKKYCAIPITWAYQNEVITGYKHNGKFGPDDNITRQDLALVLYRYASNIGMDVSKSKDINTFKDGKDVSTYAKDAMKWATAVGILSGTKEGYLMPKNEATRAECAKMLVEFYKLINQ